MYSRPSGSGTIAPSADATTTGVATANPFGTNRSRLASTSALVRDREDHVAPPQPEERVGEGEAAGGDRERGAALPAQPEHRVLGERTVRPDAEDEDALGARDELDRSRELLRLQRAPCVGQEL